MTIKPEDIDFRRLEPLLPSASEELREQQAQYLAAINDKFESISKKSSSFITLKNKLRVIKKEIKDIEKNAPADKTRPTNTKIASLAEELLVKIHKLEKSAAGRSAAAKGEAIAAKLRIQETMSNTVDVTIWRLQTDLRATKKKIKNVEEAIQAMSNELAGDSSVGKAELVDLEKDKKLLEGLANVLTAQIKRLSDESIQLKKTTKYLEEELKNNDIEKISFISKINEYQGEVFLLDVQVEYLKNKGKDYSGKELELQTAQFTLKDAQDKLSELEKQAKQLRSELEKSQAHAITLSKDTQNAVAVRKKELAAVKKQAGGLDTIAGRTCELFHFPEAIVPSIQATLKGTIKIKSKEEPVKTHGGVHALLVQPLVERGISYFSVLLNPELDRAIRARLDLTDFQKKTIMQGFLANWDLHTHNAMVQPIVNTEYLLCEDKPWEYQENDGTWKSVNFLELVQLYLMGKISDSTQVRNDPSDTKGCQIINDLSLKKALDVKWRFLPFDDDRVLGFARTPSTGDHNIFQIFSSDIQLPIRIFLLGLDQSAEPLKPEVREWILKECQGDALDEKEKIGSQGYHGLWRNFSPTTQEKLKKHISTVYYTQNMLNGGSKEKLLEHLPEDVAKEVYHDLVAHKKTKLTEKELETLPPFLKVETLAQRMSKIEQGLDEVTADIRTEDLGNFPAARQALKDYIQFYQGGGEIHTPRFSELVSTCAKELYDSPGFNLMPWKEQEAIKKRLIGTQNDLQKQAEKIDYLVLLEKGLFPAIDPSEHRALIQRSKNAVAYVKACEANVESYENREKDPGLWGPPPQVDRLCGLLDAGRENLKAMPMSVIVQSEVARDLLQRRKQVVKKLQQAVTSGAVDAALRREFEELSSAIKAVLSPTTSGVISAMFPYFDTLVDLLTVTEAFKSQFNDWTQSAKCTPNELEKIKKSLESEKSRVTGNEEADVTKDIQSVDAMRQFLLGNESLNDAGKWNVPVGEAWSDVQVQELIKILEARNTAIQNSDIDAALKKQWNDALLIKYKPLIIEAGKNPHADRQMIINTFKGHTEHMRKIIVSTMQQRLLINRNDAMHHFLLGNKSLNDAGKWNVPEGEAWSDVQVQELIEILETRNTAIQNSDIDAALKKQWNDALLIKYKPLIIEAGKNPQADRQMIINTFKDHTEHMQKIIVSTIKQRLLRDPKARPYIKQYANTVTNKKNLRELRNQILTEIHKVGEYGYSAFECSKILYDASIVGVLDISDPRYKKIKAEIAQVKER